MLMPADPDGIRDYRTDYPWSHGGLEVDRTVVVRVDGAAAARTAQVSANWYARKRHWKVHTIILLNCVLLVTRTQ